MRWKSNSRSSKMSWNSNLRWTYGGYFHPNHFIIVCIVSKNPRPYVHLEIGGVGSRHRRSLHYFTACGPTNANDKRKREMRVSSIILSAGLLFVLKHWTEGFVFFQTAFSWFQGVWSHVYHDRLWLTPGEKESRLDRETCSCHILRVPELNSKF